MFRLIRIIIVLLALLQTSALADRIPVTKETKRILVLYGLDKEHPGHILTEQGIIKGFQSNKAFEVQLFSEYLDLNRFPDPTQAKSVADYLRSKYADVKIDVIITVYPTALNVLLNQSPKLFPGLPIIAGEVTRNYAGSLERGPERHRITGTILGDNATGLLEAALRTKPGTKRFALVAGCSPLDAYSEQIFRNALKKYAARLDVIDLTRLTMQETLNRVATLPPDTILLYSTLLTDSAGQKFAPLEVLTSLSRISKVPVFYLYDTGIDHGSVGGRLISMELQGRAIADMAVRVIAGESPATIPFGGEDAYVNLYDWRELKRWQIPVSAIPADAEIRYRELTLWEEYRGFVIGTAFLAIIETALILGLIINLRRRKKAEQELSEKSLQLQLAVDSSGLGYWSIDVSTGQITASDLAREIYGFTAGDRVDLDSFLARVYPDDREMVAEFIRTAVRDRLPFENKYRVTLPDGQTRWVSANGCYSLGVLGEAVLTGVSIDITAIKNAEERYRILFDNAPDAIITYDVKTNRIVDANRQAELLFGCSLAELIDTDPLRFYGPEQPDQRPLSESFHDNVEQVVQGSTLYLERNIISATGKAVICSVHLVLLPEIDRQLIRASYLDITTAKLNFESLQREQLFTNNLLESLPGIFYLYSAPDMRLIRWNKNHETITGFSADEMYLRHTLDWFDPSEHEVIVEGLATILEQGGVTVEAKLLTKSGQTIPFEFLGKLFTDGHSQYFMGIGMDITERKQMADSLRDSEQNLRSLSGKLLSSQEEERSWIARELHDDVTQRVAVLAIELGKLELKPVANLAELKSQVGTIKNSLVKISEDIHAISRKLHPSILDDLGLVRAVQSECTAFKSREGITVTFRHETVPDQLPKVISLIIYRIIQESLRNIARHSQATSANILINCTGNVLQLSISDDGIGFDPLLVQNRVGLGLISMAERIKLVEGTISVDSLPGEGTIISVKAPLEVNRP